MLLTALKIDELYLHVALLTSTMASFIWVTCHYLCLVWRGVEDEDGEEDERLIIKDDNPFKWWKDWYSWIYMHRESRERERERGERGRERVRRNERRERDREKFCKQYSESHVK
jgi:hypothetical protein